MSETIIATIRFRRGTAALWTQRNPTPASGEPCYETDTGLVKIGNGVEDWNALDYLAGAAITGLVERLDEADIQIADIDGQLATVDDRITTAISESLVGVDARLDGTDGSVEEINETLTGRLSEESLADKIEAPLFVPESSGPIIVPTPGSMEGQAVHPSIVDAGLGGWNGYRYWLAYTPYAFSGVAGEDPCVVASHDGLEWETPTGLTNPLDVGTNSMLNSDPDLLLVDGTMYLYYREHSGGPPAYEKIMLRTSTNGTTWSAEQVVIDTTPNAYGDRLRILSPSIHHDGTQFVMWASRKQNNTVERRTSADGIAWSAAATVTLNGFGLLVNHLAVIPTGSGYLMLLQDDTGATTYGEDTSTRCIWLGRSGDGTTWTFNSAPLLRSEGSSRAMIYRTDGLYENRNGSEFLRLWTSGMDTSVDGDHWRLGYTEGYIVPIETLSEPAKAERRRAGRGAGIRRLYAKTVTGITGQFSGVLSDYARVGHVFAQRSDTIKASNRLLRHLPSDLGYTSAGDVPAMIITGLKKAWSDGGVPELRFHSRATDNNGIANGDAWAMRMQADGRMILSFLTRANGVFTNALTAAKNGDLTAARDMTVIRNLLFGPSGAIGVPKLDVGVGADGQNPDDMRVRFRTDNFRLLNKKTPTSTADVSLLAGCWAYDDNYIYIKTSTGWKRAALTTW